MTTKTLKFREGDQLITTTTTVESAVLDFQDILDACEIQDDYDADAPWKNCDGFEHTATRVNRLDGAKRDFPEAVGSLGHFRSLAVAGNIAS